MIEKAVYLEEWSFNKKHSIPVIRIKAMGSPLNNKEDNIKSKKSIQKDGIECTTENSLVIRCKKKLAMTIMFSEI